MKVTAITRRRSYIIPSIISQVTPSESSVIKKAAYEPLYLAHLRDGLNIKGVTRVSLHEPLTNLRRFLFISITKGTPRTEIGAPSMARPLTCPRSANFASRSMRTSSPRTPTLFSGRSPTAATPSKTFTSLPIADRDMGQRSEAPPAIRRSSPMRQPRALTPYCAPQARVHGAGKGALGGAGLPALRPESPWFGYSLGDWNSEWDRCAGRSAKGDWLANGRRTENRLSSTAEAQQRVESAPAENL